jgi:large subunit ribosomal protein L4
MTYSVDIYNAKGKVVDTVSLDPSIFSDDKVNNDLIHEYYLLQQSNARLPIAHSKTRAEVQGSGRKLFKQKGTGNARPGSLRSPVRRKWWVAFGPRSERNYVKSMTKKARKLALMGLLTLKAKESGLLGLDQFGLTAIKTKDALWVLHAIGLQNQKVLVVLDVKSETVEKSLRNVEWVKYLYVDYLNPSDLLYYDKVLFLKPALDKVNTVA